MKPWLRWTMLGCLVLLAILLPFVLWERAIAAWTARLLTPAAGRGALAALVVLLLSADILLPVPSSFVAAGAVSLLGAAQGGATIAVGMSIAAWLGYALGRVGGQPLVARFAGPQELARAQRLMGRYGSWVLVSCRGVPVLAEASTLLAGATHVPAWRFGLVTAIGNVGLAAAYAAIGLFELSGGWAVAAPFAFGVGVPALALAVVRPLASE